MVQPAELSVAAAYGAMALVALHQSLQRVRLEQSTPMQSSLRLRAYSRLLAAAFLLRAVWILLVDPDDGPQALPFALFNAGNALQFAAYSMVVLYWEEVLRQSYKRRAGAAQPCCGRRFTWAVVAAFSLGQVGFTVAMALAYGDSSDDDDKAGHLAKLNAVLCALALSALAVAFLATWGRFYRQLGEFQWAGGGAAMSRATVQRVLAVNSVCALCLLSRPALLVAVFDAGFLERADEHFELSLATFVVPELVPAAALLALMRPSLDKEAAPRSDSLALLSSTLWLPSTDLDYDEDFGGHLDVEDEGLLQF